MVSILIDLVLISGTTYQREVVMEIEADGGPLILPAVSSPEVEDAVTGRSITIG